MSARVKKYFNLKKALNKLYKGNFKDFLTPAGELIIQENILDIHRQRTPTGRPLKKNAPSTLRRKQKLGKGSKSLIWDKILVSPSTWTKKVYKNKVIVYLKPVRAKIADYVRHKGYSFFGISLGARKKILKSWRAFIKRGFK